MFYWESDLNKFELNELKCSRTTIVLIRTRITLAIVTVKSYLFFFWFKRVKRFLFMRVSLLAFFFLF